MKFKGMAIFMALIVTVGLVPLPALAGGLSAGEAPQKGLSAQASKAIKKKSISVLYKMTEKSLDSNGKTYSTGSTTTYTYNKSGLLVRENKPAVKASGPGSLTLSPVKREKTYTYSGTNLKSVKMKWRYNTSQVFTLNKKGKATSAACDVDGTSTNKVKGEYQYRSGRLVKCDETMSWLGGSRMDTYKLTYNKKGLPVRMVLDEFTGIETEYTFKY